WLKCGELPRRVAAAERSLRVWGVTSSSKDAHQQVAAKTHRFTSRTEIFCSGILPKICPRRGLSCNLALRELLMVKHCLVTFSAAFVLSAFLMAARLAAQAQQEPPKAADPEAAVLATKLATAQKTLDDWPNLARYREANTKVVPPQKKEARVVFMGDSITDAWVRPEYGGFFLGKPYIDRGISGQTTPQMLVRVRPDVIAL